MDILDALRLASSADLYRLHLTVARLLDDPKRIIEIRRHLNLSKKAAQARAMYSGSRLPAVSTAEPLHISRATTTTATASSKTQPLRARTA